MSVEYQCNRCDDSFDLKIELVMHFWLVHKLTIEQAEKETDSRLYGGADSGCAQASEHLGYPSSCQSCPFKRCGYDRRRQRMKIRNTEIRKIFKDRVSIADIAVIYGVSPRTVQRVVKKLRGAKANA